MLLNKKQATDLAKSWRLGNKFRKKSLTKKHNLAPASSKNTGRVKMGIRMDIESKPREYYPALDDDGSLIFFTGNPMKRIQVSDLFVPPKAGDKNKRQRVPAKEHAMINYKQKILETLFPNEDKEILEKFEQEVEFNIENYSITGLQQRLKGFKLNLDERTEYQLVAQKSDGTELKSSWYKTENDLADMQQKCEDSDDYESTSVLKRIVDVDEDEDNDQDFSSILPTDVLDGEEIEGGQNFSEEEVEEGNDAEMLKLTTLALKQIPGSPKQRDTIKKLNALRIKAGMKPLKEMEIDINDEISEARMPAMKYVIYDKKTKEVYAASTNPFDKFKMSDVARDNKVNKSDLAMKKMRKGQEVGTQLKEYVGPALTPANQIAKKHGGKVKSIMAKDAKGKKTKMFYAEEEEAELEEAKVFDKIKFKGADKKLASSVVDMIKSKAKPKEIAKSFKKLKLPSQELIMKALGDKSAQDLLQKGQLLNQLVGIFDEVDPKGLDGRTKAFKEKLRKLEYNKKKKLPFEVFEEKDLDEQPIHNDDKKSILRHQELAVQAHRKGDREAVKFHQDKIRKLRSKNEGKSIKEKKLKALQTKADKTGIPYGILKQVFNRGVAAWRTGHRPGTNPTQWGYARVNSFATKSKGTWGGADKDLAAKARKSM